MSSGMYVLVQCLLLFIDVVTLCMTVRVIMSWLFVENDSKIGRFLFVVTEPLILPVRALCDKFGWFRGMPFDMPFFLSALLIMLLRIFLEGSLGV